MNRALAPWLMPLAMLVGVLVAATGAVWLFGRRVSWQIGTET